MKNFEWAQKLAHTAANFVHCPQNHLLNAKRENHQIFWVGLYHQSLHHVPPSKL